MAEAEKHRTRIATQAAADAVGEAKRQAERLMAAQPVKIARNIPVAHLAEDAARRAVHEARATVHQAEKVDETLGFGVFHQKPVELPPQLVNELAQLKEVGIRAVKGDQQAKADFEKLRKQYSHDLAAFLSSDADMRVSDAAENLRRELGQKHEFVAEFRKEMRESGLIDMLAPGRSQGYWLYRRLGKIANEIDAIRGEIGKAKDPEQVVKRLEELYKDYKLVMDIYHPAKLVLAELKKGEALEAYLKDSEAADHSPNKVYALADLRSARDHLMEALRIMQYSPENMDKAKREFKAAAEDKTNALTRLYINENTLSENVRLAADMRFDPTKRFAFYKDALIAAFDASTHGKGMDSNLTSLSGALMQLEVCMAISDKKLFTHGESGLQQRVIADSEKLVANYMSLLAGGKATIPDAESVSAAAKKDSETLYSRIKSARRIDQLVELGASLVPFIGPAFMTASVIKGAAHDYAETGEISPMTGVMAATALVGLRGGIAREAFAAIERSATLKFAELGIAGALTVPQVSHMAESWAAYYTAPKADKAARQDALEEAIFSSISLTMPLIAGAVHGKVSRMLDARETFAPGNRPMRPRKALSEDLQIPEISEEATRRSMKRALPAPKARMPDLEEAIASERSASASPAAEAGASKSPSRKSGEHRVSDHEVGAIPEISSEPSAVPEREAPTAVGRIVSQAEIESFNPFTNEKRLEAVDRFLALKPMEQERFVRALRAADQKDLANYLTELRDIPALEKFFGIPEGDLASIYRGGRTITEARKQILIALDGSGVMEFGLKPILEKINRLAERGVDVDDVVELESLQGQLNTRALSLATRDDLFGLLLSGNLLQNIETIAPGTRVTSIYRYGGMVGTFNVTLDNGTSLFVVPQDANPHMAGAIASRIAGIPSPGARAKIMGRDLEFVDSDGFRHKYGISTDIENFSGTLPVYDRKVQVDATGGASVKSSFRRAELYKFIKDRLDAGQPIDTRTVLAEIERRNPSLARMFGENPAMLDLDLKTLKENPMLYKIIAENPALAWREFGFAQTAFMNAASYDGHELNAWMMMFRVSEEDAAYLKGKGYDIFRDAGGKPQILRAGRIDTDAFGYFRALRGENGRYDYQSLLHRYGAEDLRRVFDAVAQIQNRTPREVADEAYTNIPEGATKWSHEVGANPEFHRNIRLLYAGRGGMAVGIGMPMEPAEKVSIKRAIEAGQEPRVIYQGDPFNGKPMAIITDIYGRTTLNADDLVNTLDDFSSRNLPDEFREVWRGIQAETNNALIQLDIQNQAEGGVQ